MSSILQNININKDINTICNMTSYDRDTAIEKLKLHNNNVESVIREYLTGSAIQSQDNKHVSTNQAIYSTIRTFMDKSTS